MFASTTQLLLALLMLSPLAAAQRLTEHRITLPLVPPTNGADQPLRISGYFKLDRTHDAHMFYFYFQNRNLDPKAPVVLWMTGGPGCSSELAIFEENGPFHIRPNLTLEISPYGWDNVADLIYVDQPINTGFSYSEDPRDEVYDEEGVSNDMLDFLNELFQAHPELQGRDLYITGESYAGHYVPAVTWRIFRANRDKEPWVKACLNLKGFAIGNGLTDPAIQYGAYADFAALNGLISEDARQLILSAFPACKAAIDVCNGHDWKAECLLAVQYCQTTQVSSILALAGNINIYDIRKECIGDLCYDFSRMEEYLNLPETRKALGVGDREWEECNMEVYEDMQGDWMKNYSYVIPPMLEAGIQALVYAGDQDFICNYIGNERWVANLTWDGRPEHKPHPQPWLVDGEEAGTVTDYGAMQFLRIYDAGHMVPLDQPKNSLASIEAFVNGRPLTPGNAQIA